jgi:hypothetical protein
MTVEAKQITISKPAIKFLVHIFPSAGKNIISPGNFTEFVQSKLLIDVTRIKLTNRPKQVALCDTVACFLPHCCLTVTLFRFYRVRLSMINCCTEKTVS